jgi:hypothetical protein
MSCKDLKEKKNLNKEYLVLNGKSGKYKSALCSFLALTTTPPLLKRKRAAVHWSNTLTPTQNATSIKH